MIALAALTRQRGDGRGRNVRTGSSPASDADSPLGEAREVDNVGKQHRDFPV